MHETVNTISKLKSWHLSPQNFMKATLSFSLQSLQEKLRS